MASDRETYSSLVRLDRSEDEYLWEIEDSFDDEAFRGAIHRGLNDFDRRRDAYIQRLGDTNLWNNINSLRRHEGNLIETKTQDNFNSAQNAGGYFGRVGYRAILEHLVRNGNFERKATSTANSIMTALKSKKVEGEDEIFICAICQDLVNVGETGKELPCMHDYHAGCIQSWLARKNTCPICRFELPTSDHDQERDE